MTRTNAHALLTVGLRVVAAFYLVTTLATVVGQFFFVSADATAMARDIWIVQLSTCILFGLLWLFADRVAGFGLSSRTAPTFESTTEPPHWLAVGIALIGVWVVAENLGSLAYYAALKWAMTRPSLSPEPRDFDAQARAEVFACLLQLVMGAWMTLKARGLAHLIHKLRFAGASQAVRDEPRDSD